MRFRTLFTLLLSLIVPAGSASADMRFNFENCYKLWPFLSLRCVPWKNRSMRSRSWFGHRKMWNVFLQRKRTPPRKSWPAKWISPRILPMLGGIFGGFLSSANNRKLVAFTSKISWNAFAIMLQSCYIMVYIQKSCWQHNENDLAMTFLKPVEWKWNRNEPSGAEKDWKSGEQDRCWFHIYCDHSLPHCIKGWSTGKTRYHYDGTMPRKN